MSERDKVNAVCNRFPDEFGLRAFPGKRFSVCKASSFMGADGVQVYVYVWDDDRDEWLAFSRGTEAEIRKEMR